jgi:hypothetical protein
MEFNELEQPRQTLDLNSAPWIECTCNGMIYESAVMVKRVSALISPTGKEEIVPLDVIVCKSCGKIPSFYAKKLPVNIPEDLISE